MEYFKDQISLLVKNPAGVFLVALIIADVLCLLGGMAFLAIFRIKAHLFSRNHEENLTSFKEIIEKHIATDEDIDDEFRRISALIPLKNLSQIFIEYTNMIIGGSHSDLLDLFRETPLSAYATSSCGSRKWWARLQSVRLMELVPDGQRETMLLRLLDDTHPIIRMSAVLASPMHPSERVVNRMFSLFDREESYEMHALKETLVRLGPEATAPMKLFLEKRHSEKSLSVGLEVAGKIRDPILAAPILEVMRRTIGDTKAEATRALGSYPDDEIVAELIAALDDEDEKVRAMAAYSLGAIGYSQALEKIEPLLSDRAWIVRFHSAAAIKRMGEQGLEVLRKTSAGDDRFAADMAGYILKLPEFALNL